MFCSNCGVKASGNFCHACGNKLSASEAVPTVQPAAILPMVAWQEEIRYEMLIKVPHVRTALAKLATDAEPGLTANDYLNLCDSVFKPMGPISMSKVAPMLQKMYGNWGIKTGKERKETIAQPPGVVLFKVLCALARACQKIKEVSQGDDGCIIQAVIPSSLWTMEGKLLITVSRVAGGTQVETAATITGQYYDWGVSNKVLEQLYQSMKAA